MKIVVCIKQVPDTSEVRMSSENTLIRKGLDSIINPFDVYALEEALLLKEQFGARVVAITMGPKQAYKVLKEAIGLGVDETIHLCDKNFAGSDTWATSLILARAIEKIGDVDVVLCGKQAIDGDTAQVGPGIAAHLDIAQATNVRRIDSVHFDTEPKVFIVERLLENGYEVLKLCFPAVITVVKEINKPRMLTLAGFLRSRKTDILQWNNQDLKLDLSEIGLNGSPTRVFKTFKPEIKKENIILRGNPKESVQQLLDKVKLSI